MQLLLLIVAKNWEIVYLSAYNCDNEFNKPILYCIYKQSLLYHKNNIYFQNISIVINKFQW